eukprot:842897-Rhodomonas_salina.6
MRSVCQVAIPCCVSFAPALCGTEFRNFTTRANNCSSVTPRNGHNARIFMSPTLSCSNPILKLPPKVNWGQGFGFWGSCWEAQVHGQGFRVEVLGSRVDGGSRNSWARKCLLTSYSTAHTTTSSTQKCCFALLEPKRRILVCVFKAGEYW